MNPMRGLEMVVIGKETAFEVTYEGGRYLDPKGQPVEGIFDMTCFACSNPYYTLESQPIEFCPKCGQFERMRFETLRDISQWANKQNWKYLKYSGMQVFAVTRGDGWHLAFAPDRQKLEMKGIYLEINALRNPG